MRRDCWGTSPCRRSAPDRPRHAEENFTRSADSIDASGVLHHLAGVLVRDGYDGYTHLHHVLHAWCGVHLLRDCAASTTPTPRTSCGPAPWPTPFGQPTASQVRPAPSAGATHSTPMNSTPSTNQDHLLGFLRGVQLRRRDFSETFTA
ncbi:IS66 family transposase [Streptomyces sporangiiformans]|uniref:IS66 family transposase n=1 Tax=Streptomyces sporangiiformans TaxID=2315329 RepID=UPI0013C42D42